MFNYKTLKLQNTGAQLCMCVDILSFEQHIVLSSEKFNIIIGKYYFHQCPPPPKKRSKTKFYLFVNFICRQFLDYGRQHFETTTRRISFCDESILET